MRSSSGTAKLIAGIVAALILALGAGYLVTRTTAYQSNATLLLAPTVTDPDVLPGVLESFTRSATANTYVELLASSDTLRAAGSPRVDVTVRAIPESRAIGVTTEGDEALVRPALRRIIDAAKQREDGLRDVWELAVLAAPSAPESVGAPAAYVIIATIILALLGAGIVLVSLRRFVRSPADAAPPVIETRDDRTRRPVAPFRSSSERQ